MILFSVEASKVALTKLLLAEEDLLNTYMGNNNNTLLLLTKKIFCSTAKNDWPGYFAMMCTLE